MNPSISPHLESPASASTIKNAKEVNIPLNCVKNMRDLATASTVLLPGKIFRTGCVSKANDTDVRKLRVFLDDLLNFILSLSCVSLQFSISS